MKNTKQKQKDLYKMLLKLNDHRRAQGRMHELRFCLILVIMATMSGFHSLRAIGDFIEKNKKELIKTFKPRNDKLPSYLTIGRVLQNIDFDKFTQIFYAWSTNFVKIENDEWISIDGKGINGTLKNSGTKHQNLISLISVFASKRKQVVNMRKINGKKESEIPAVKELIKMLDLEDTIFTIDALHCQKDTIKTIIESNNNYCIGVKGNQKKLHKQLKKTQSPINQ